MPWSWQLAMSETAVAFQWAPSSLPQKSQLWAPTFSRRSSISLG
jgi:hypothetical protein